MRIRVPLLAVLTAAALAVPAAAQDPTAAADRFAEVAERDVAAVTDPERHAAAVDAFEGSPAHETLGFQHALAGDVGMVDAPWAGTHNSFNSIAEMGPPTPALSAQDSNQQLGLVDQLRIGIRSLELDVHLWLGRPAVCHAGPDHSGCTIEKSLDETLRPIEGWLREHPGEVVLLYLEDHLDTPEGYDAGAAVVRARLGHLLFEPQGSGCTDLPGTLTRDDVEAAGKQVVIVSDCGQGSGWPSVAHSWESHRESRPVGFEGFPDCGPDFTREDYDTRLIRYFEDSTFVNAAGSQADATTPDDGLTPETTREMGRCGVDLLGFDQLVPGDGRLEALVWSWADGVPESGRCAVARGSDGRWEATSKCTGAARPQACRTADGGWTVAASCDRAGATWAVPRTARENALLAQAAGGKTVVLGLERTAGGWRALDAR
jgi:hypothetical protein